MTLEECKTGMLVRAVKDLEPGFWATGLILGEVVEQSDPHVSVKFISHANYKEYEGHTYYCQPRHLVPVSNDREAGLNDDLTTLFNE